MIRTPFMSFQRQAPVFEPRPLGGEAETLPERDRPAVDREPLPRLARAGIFWSADGSPGATESFYGSGKYVAARAWTQALTQGMSGPGLVERADVFAPITGIDRCAAHLQESLGAEPRPGAAVRLLAESDLPAQLQAHRYDVLHEPSGIDLTRASYARSRFSRHLFPLTAAQMGISYSFDLHSVFLRLLMAQTYPCDAIVCSTQSSRRALENRLSDVAERYSRAWGRPAPPLPRLEVIPWGIDTLRFAPRDPGPARRDLGLPADRPIVLCLGRVRIQDKMDWTPLLLAFERVLKTAKPRPLLVLAGTADPAYSDQILAHAAELGLGPDIRTFFDLPSACLPSLYAAADLFVSPADTPSESFGLTIVEAMACGRPVVASDWNGYQELIVHGETGFKVRTYWANCLGELDQIAPMLAWDQQHLHVGQSVSVDVGQMAAYLLRLLENPALRAEMGRRGRARVEALYDWPVVMNQWVAMWTELGAIARSLEGQQPDRLDYLQPHYFEHFSHYASRAIDDSTPVWLTERGKERLAGRGSFFLHSWTRGFLHPRHLHAALTALKPAGWLGTCLPAGKLVEALLKRHGLTRDQALMHLMWLAKYDLIALGEEPAS